ncbi:hypothetical protein [Palaeococcus pacificus]|nr:hypothetical protein [Palaeococcus pacificus]
MIESEDIERAVNQALSDKKFLEALIELLEDDVPGIRGDAMLVLSEVISKESSTLKNKINDKFILKIIELSSQRNSYVKDNAMVLLNAMIQNYPEAMSKYRDKIAPKLIEMLEVGDKNDKAFALLMIKELKIKEAMPKVEELLEVQDKVILPFEGRKWVPLGEIAKEVLETLGGE